jgi:predicted nuclease of predicted toxin-antitoxin system
LKLFFDQNLSHRLIKLLVDVYPESSHVRLAGLAQADDVLLWEHAAQGEYLLVTKDEDFLDLSTIRGFPPKVIYIGIGNCSVEKLEQLLRSNLTRIEAFSRDEEESFLILGRL